MRYRMRKGSSLEEVRKVRKEFKEVVEKMKRKNRRRYLDDLSERDEYIWV